MVNIGRASGKRENWQSRPGDNSLEQQRLGITADRINKGRKERRTMECKIFKTNDLKRYKYVVVLSRYEGKILLSRHKNRTTWETQGGHIEPGETPLEAAKRELYEEAGAVEYTIAPLCDYCAGEEEIGAGTGGMVFAADIRRLGDIPDSEMAETGLFDELPENLTYPDITPVLFAQLIGTD